MNDSTKFVIAAGGIYLCYFYFAIIQERITQVRYGKEPNKDGMIGERFTYSLIVVAIQCYFGWILARVILIFKSPAADKTFFGFYLSGAVTYLGSMSFANMALKYINVSSNLRESKRWTYSPIFLVSHASCGQISEAHSSVNSKCNLGRTFLHEKEVRLSVRYCYRIHSVHVQGRRSQ